MAIDVVEVLGLEPINFGQDIARLVQELPKFGRRSCFSGKPTATPNDSDGLVVLSHFVSVRVEAALNPLCLEEEWRLVVFSDCGFLKACVKESTIHIYELQRGEYLESGMTIPARLKDRMGYVVFVELFSELERLILRV